MPSKHRNIAILEDDSHRCQQMRISLTSLCRHCHPIFFANAQAMISWLRKNQPSVHLISLDHDLPICRDPDNQIIDSGTGRQVAEFLVSTPPTCPIIVHTSNSPAGYAMMHLLRESHWPVARVYPHDSDQWIGNAWIIQVKALLAE